MEARLGRTPIRYDIWNGCRDLPQSSQDCKEPWKCTYAIGDSLSCDQTARSSFIRVLDPADEKEEIFGEIYLFATTQRKRNNNATPTHVRRMFFVFYCKVLHPHNSWFESTSCSAIFLLPLCSCTICDLKFLPMSLAVRFFSAKEYLNTVFWMCFS